MQIGVAEVDITPELGLPLMGNYRDDYAARGVHDPLSARAIAFRDDVGGSAALLAVEVCMLDRHHVAAIRETASRSTGLAAEDILVAATHTHSSLAMVDYMGLPTAPADAVQRLVDRAAQAVSGAWRNLAPAELAIGYAAEPRLSFNRRLLCRDGRTHMNWESLDEAFVVEPLGETDPRLAAVRILRSHGASAPPSRLTAADRQGDEQAADAILVNFALHPAILAGDNWLYSADYPGYLAEALRHILGPNVTTLFFNGCCGDVNHLDCRDPLQGRGYQMAQRVGYMLAAAAAEAIRQAVPLRASPIRISRRFVPLPRLQIDQQQLCWSREVLERTSGRSAQGQVDGLPEQLYARTWLQMHQHQADDAVEVMAIRLGALGIVGLPGEVFCAQGLAIRNNSPAPHTLVIELANDAVGYLPPREAFEQGGYEPTPGSTRYRPGAIERLVESSLQQLRALFGDF